MYFTYYYCITIYIYIIDIVLLIIYYYFIILDWAQKAQYQITLSFKDLPNPSIYPTPHHVPLAQTLKTLNGSALKPLNLNSKPNQT